MHDAQPNAWRLRALATLATLLTSVSLAPWSASAAAAATPPLAASSPASSGETPPPPAPPPPAQVERIARADDLASRGQLDAALAELGEVAALPPAALARARILRLRGKLDDASAALGVAEIDPTLGNLVATERGLIAAAKGDSAAVIERLLPVVVAKQACAQAGVLELAKALVDKSPDKLIANYDALDAARPPEDLDARSLLLGAKAAALTKLGKKKEALEVEKKRYIEEGVSLVTPEAPPAGVELTPAEKLARIEVLLASHRNERAAPELEALADSSLRGLMRCQKYLGLGLARRKLREYAAAEANLAKAMTLCEADEDRERRASYLHAKVVSIRDGLRSVAVIEAFAKRYPSHSMTDDVLFWGGDIYQHRGRDTEAESFYKRVLGMKPTDDQCAEAAWRLAWMAYRRGDDKAARAGLTELLSGKSCQVEAFDRARAQYWLGRIAQRTKDDAAAIASFKAAVDEEALGYYGQQALVRMSELAPAEATPLLSRVPPAPVEARGAAACEEKLHTIPAFQNGVRFLALGLRHDAARELLAIPMPKTEVLGSSHASNLGLAAKPIVTQAGTTPTAPGCGDQEMKLSLALLLDRAGAFKDAHWRLRTDFALELEQPMRPETAALWRAAYPLAWRPELEAAEKESGLPKMLLQALAREESAYDPKVVSWAGAYGLTQLLLSTGRDAGRLLSPQVKLARAEDLLDPALNARLGGAMMASLLKRFGGNPALALAAYNAGIDNATAWWRHNEAEELDVLAEEITIQETRGYVKRVLRTYGIYRWLYGGATPALAINLKLPKRS